MVYRQYIKSETALVSVLNQIVQLDDKLDAHDVEELRELCGLYEKLARWRDLLSNQLKLAEVTPDLEEKKNLYRAAARRWLEQFSNVQNATEAYAALLKAAPAGPGAPIMASFRATCSCMYAGSRRRSSSAAWPSLR